MFKEIYEDEKLIGHQFDFSNGFAFFGTKNISLSEIKSKFSQFKFSHLKQIHSDKVVKASNEVFEADGHWTTSPFHALLIQTADCIPAMIHTPDQVVALHAGWRGVEQQILLKAFELVKNPQDMKIACGPFISKDSFEVGRDIASRLLYSDPTKDQSSILPHADSEKNYVDLRQIFTNQAHSIDSNPPIDFLEVDTFKSSEHFSYRRNGANAGRLFSFIVLT